MNRLVWELEETIVLDAPTEAQIKAGNYPKHHIRMHGFEISIENKKGTTRSGKSKGGKKWSVKMAHDYGYIRRTEGADGDHLDVFIGPYPKSEKIFVVYQIDPQTKRFDEHKVMFGFNTQAKAEAGYLANYEKGWKGIGKVKELTVDEFKDWLDEADLRIDAHVKKPGSRGGHIIGYRHGEPIYGKPKTVGQKRPRGPTENVMGRPTKQPPKITVLKIKSYQDAIKKIKQTSKLTFDAEVDKLIRGRHHNMGIWKDQQGRRWAAVWQDDESTKTHDVVDFFEFEPEFVGLDWDQINELDEAASRVGKTDVLYVDDEYEVISALFGRIRMGLLERETPITASARYAAQLAAAAVSDRNLESIKPVLERVLKVDLFQAEPWLLPEARNWVAENVALIKSVASSNLDEVEKLIYRMVREGKSIKEVREELAGRFGVSKSRARLIARDQVNKYNGRLTQVRQQNVGIKEYKWFNVQDQRVRGEPAKGSGGKYPKAVPSHTIMHEVRCRWDDPTVYHNGKKWVPRTGKMPKAHPGEEIQCRCLGLPVLPDWMVV